MECEQKEKWNWQLTQNNETSYSLPRGLIFIGCEGCDIILKSPGIEKRHAVISYNTEQQEFCIKDLNSLTGTYVNGTRIAEQLYIKLHPEDSIRLGYGPIFVLTQAGKNASTGSSNLKQKPEFPKLEETDLHDSLEDICELPLQSEEKPFISPPPPVANNSVEMLKEVGSPTKVMYFPSPTKSPLSGENAFSDIAIINRSPVRSSYKDEAANLVKNNNNISENSPTDGLYCNSSRTPEAYQPTAMAFTIPFDLEMPKKKVRARESASRFASSKSDSENGHSYRSPVLSSRKDDRQLSEKMNGSSRELPSPPGKSNGSPLNDSASYLIHKMLGGGEITDDAYGVPKYSALQSRKFSLEKQRPSPTSSSGDKQSSEYSLPRSPCSPVKPITKEKDADEKSETGTYTVETELTDPDVDEARKKIDEVFGVYKPSDKLPPRQTSKESNGVPFPQLRSPHNGSDLSDRDSGSSREPAPVTRPKRRLPTPPVEKVNLNFDVNPPRENSYSIASIKGKRADTFIQDYPAAKPPLPSSFTPSGVPKPPPRFYSSKSHGEQKGDPAYSRTDQRLLHRQSDSGMCGSLSDSGSNNRQFFGSPWRRMSWNRSCSDLELDQSKSDSASMASDISTSTEPSSHSSGRNKNEVGPQMRLNRAFALRRARLGFDTDDLQPSARLANTKQMSRPGEHSSHSSPNSLSRQDGGRFSLRLPRSTTVRLSKFNKPQETKVVRQPQAWAAPPHKSAEAKDPTGIADDQSVAQKAKREVSALDSLVISAIYQLSVKLKVGASTLLERERQKHKESSDSRLMIDELLPQMGDKKTSEMSAEGNLTRDLSSILRNLKRVEQVVEVISVLGEQTGTSKESQRREKGGFFIVDV